MVRIRSYSVNATDTNDALRELTAAIDPNSSDAKFVFAFYNCVHDDRLLRAYLAERFLHAAVLGGTSCSGIMTEQGVVRGDAIGLLVIEDDEGDYGVAAGAFGDEPAESAEAVLRQALENAGCPGELPELVWVYQSPGHEEEVIAGLRRVIGDRCPIIGGSAADNSIAGDWRVLTADTVLENGLAVSVLFPSGGIGYAFQGGYEPLGPTGLVTSMGYSATGDAGTVTRQSGRRIHEIDGRAAATVYNSWTEDALGAKVVSGGNVLAETTMYPVAVKAGEIQGVPHYLLIHPESVSADGSLSTFASVSPGTRLYAMRGDRDLLIERAGRVVTQAKTSLSGVAEDSAGAMVVYCAGCMLAVDQRMPEVAEHVATSFGDAPFLGCFTFGEQGRLINQNVHGNLMISAIVFGR